MKKGRDSLEIEFEKRKHLRPYLIQLFYVNSIQEKITKKTFSENWKLLHQKEIKQLRKRKLNAFLHFHPETKFFKVNRLRKFLNSSYFFEYPSLIKKLKEEGKEKGDNHLEIDNLFQRIEIVAGKILEIPETDLKFLSKERRAVVYSLAMISLSILHPLERILSETRQIYEVEKKEEEMFFLAEKWFLDASEKEDSINKILETLIENFKIDRVEKIILSVLRWGAYEILYLSTPPFNKTLNEILKTTHHFCDKASLKFVNAILDKIASQKYLTS